MPLQLEIVSPERRAFTDEVDMVIVPGIDGQLGILPHHTRLISALGVGELRIKKGGTEQSMLISGGFVEVRPDKVIVMADLAEHSGEIDAAKAVEARKRAESELEQSKDPVDIARVRAALQTALMRERIATRRRSRGQAARSSSTNSVTRSTRRIGRISPGTSRREGSLKRRGWARRTHRPRVLTRHSPAASTFRSHSTSVP